MTIIRVVVVVVVVVLLNFNRTKYLKSGWTPVDELNVALCLDSSNGVVDVLGYNITAVQQAAGHVLTIARVALDHLMRRLEAGVGDLGHAVLLVIRLVGRHDRSVGGQREVDARIRHEVRLELGQVDVQSSVETQRRSDGTYHLTHIGYGYS